MRTMLFGIGWGFAFLAAAHDCCFAWQYREVFDCWEMNPLIRWAMDQVGLLAIFGFKLAGLGLAAGLAWYCRNHQPFLSRALTLFVIAVYGLLTVHYVMGYRQPAPYEVASHIASDSATR